MGAEIIVNHTNFETRVALVENHQVTELFIERERDKGVVGNIYKGRVSKVLPGMQAAFVDIGMKKAGFLYVADINHGGPLPAAEQVQALVVSADEEDLPPPTTASGAASPGMEGRTGGAGDAAAANAPELAPGCGSEEGVAGMPLLEGAGSPLTGSAASPEGQQGEGGAGGLLSRPAIEEILHEGQEVLVQVSKEPLGSKGCRLTTFITLAGRYLVYMPGVDHVGVSRRIEDEHERTRLRDLLLTIKPPQAGFIVRTVSEGMNEEAFASDIDYLTRLWGTIQETERQKNAPELVHPDLDLVLRSIRDLFSSSVDRFLVDDPAEYERCVRFVRSYLPHLEPKIELYTGEQPIFDAYAIEIEIERALQSKIWLKSGGYITIDATEALVAIDVNTGRFVGSRNAEETILTTNLEAVNEIVYQLRLRNLGGLIIIDFIDMEREESKERVFQALENALKTDRSRTNILKVSELGLVEMTRKRVREGLARTLCRPCPYCQGRGYVKSPASVGHEVFREIIRGERSTAPHQKVLVSVHPEVADYIFDEAPGYLEHLEWELQKNIIIKADRELHQEHFEVNFV
ncbi:MAG: Rne/Rng family ribonuclease [Candidatus Tectomicrobia bacterium]|nr:Rne/Rng family ribonuclease [Candidatus Tectomicrobia bacterium]